MDEVAKRAGVSTATVSRVINGISVRPQLRERVEEAVSQLGYRPDRQGRQLRLQRSDAIAMILPDIENPFYTALARGVIDTTRGMGFSTGLWNSDDLADKEDAYLDAVREEKVAGVIIAASTPTPHVGDLIADGRAIVAVDRPVDLPIDSIHFDNIALGRRATADLFDRGYRRIACITGPSDARAAVDRAEGWRKEMRRRKQPMAGLLRRSNAHVDGGRAAAKDLFAAPVQPDAIVCANSLIVIGVLQALGELGGNGVGLSAIGDLPFAIASPPNLSVLRLTPRTMGEKAAEMLMERINGLRGRPRRIVHPVADPQPVSWG